MDKMTVKPAAELIGCSAQNVRQLAQRGTITGKKIGRDWLLDAQSVQEYATKNKCKNDQH